MSEQPVSIFFSYSHRDEALRDELESHLAFLRWQGRISAWHDRRLLPGDEWDHVIKEELNQADIILLLVTHNFINSQYCWDVEVKRAIERHEAEEASVVPIILSSCVWKRTPFSRLNALPRDGKAVTEWDDRNLAYVNIAEGIDRLVEEISKLKSGGSETPPPTSGSSSTRKELQECDPAKILYMKNVKDPEKWAYSLDRMQKPETRSFELFWRKGSHGYQRPLPEDLMILHQRARVTHVVEFLDNQIRETDNGFFRWVRAVWMPEQNWSQLPHQKEVLGFSPNYADGNTHSLKSPNFTTFRKAWNSLEEFQSHLVKCLTQSKLSTTSEDILPSERGVNYAQLQDLLKAGKWKEADQETAAIMIRLSDGELKGQFQFQNINIFPCKDLLSIDYLWQKHSQGKFGFTAQKDIWSSASRDFKDLACRVGWYDNLGWVKEQDIQYVFTAPKGHLPTLRWVEIHGWAIGNENSGYNIHGLLEKLLTCLECR